MNFPQYVRNSPICDSHTFWRKCHHQPLSDNTLTAWCNYRPFSFISFEGYCLPTNGLFYYLEQVEVMVELYCLLKKWKYWNLGKYYWNIGGIFNNNCIAVNNSSMHFPIKPWYFSWTGEFSWFDLDLTHPGLWFDLDTSQ